MTTFSEAIGARESNVVRQVRRVLIAIACLYALSFAWSIYRRIRQVLRIDVRTASFDLAPGSLVGYDVVTSGEVGNRIRLELIQDAQREILLEQRASVNHVSGLDPRVFRYTPTVAITPALLAPFHTGRATLRVTAFGGQKLLHTPPPRIAEVVVRLRLPDAVDKRD